MKTAASVVVIMRMTEIWMVAAVVEIAIVVVVAVLVMVVDLNHVHLLQVAHSGRTLVVALSQAEAQSSPPLGPSQARALSRRGSSLGTPSRRMTT